MTKVNMNGTELRDALDAIPLLRRVQGSPATLPAELVFGSVAHPERPRLYADANRIVMVAGTADPLTHVPFRTAWTLSDDLTDSGPVDGLDDLSVSGLAGFTAA